MRCFGLALPAVAVALVSALISCSTTDSPTAAVFPGFEYPLALGTSWSYEIRWAVYTTYTGEPGQVDSVITLFTSEVRSDRSEELEGVGELVVLREDLSSGDESWWSEVLVENRARGLYEYAHRGNSFRVLPKAGRQRAFPFQPITASLHYLPSVLLSITMPRTVATSDSLYVEDRPIRVLTYPLRVGDRWTYREGEDLRILRQVTGIDTVNTPVGQFICAVIEARYDIDGDGEWE